MKNLARHIVTTMLMIAVFTASVGIPVIHHFCMGTSEGITVFLKQRCCDGGEEMPKDCCHDDVVLQQMNDDGILSPSQGTFTLPMAAMLYVPLVIPIVDDMHAVTAVIDTSPPSRVNIPIINQSLLI